MLFSGSGADLSDIPRSALTEDALLSTEIVSGSVTASVSPNDGFVVTSVISGSTFDGELRLTSGSSFSGSGEKLFDIPRSALTEDALLSTEIVTGSITASVTPEGGFVVTSLESGSTFFGDIKLQTGSFSGSGAKLFDIPRTALTPDALVSTLIASGSATASISPNFGFVVNTSSSIEGDLTVDNDLYVGGAINATELNVTFINSEVIYSSGSNTFGDSVTDRQEFTGSINVSGSLNVDDGIISGDGSGLFNIPQSALSEDAILIASGSVTASVSPDKGFKVESIDKGSQFTGSVSITGSVDITNTITSQIVIADSISGSFSGSGKDLIDIPFSQLTGDAFRIASGSVTASVTPDDGFVVTSIVSGSQFTGSVDISGSISASRYDGDGSGLFNIPQSALSEDASRIASGSVTASVDPIRGFEVNSTGRFEDTLTITGSLIVNNQNRLIDNLTKVITVQSTDAGNKYFVDGIETPLIYLTVGNTYTFNQSDSSNSTHEIRFSTTDDGTHGGGSSYTTDVDNGSIAAGTDGSAVTIQITAETPTTLYYYCLNHSGMGGSTLQVNVFPSSNSLIEDDVKISGSLIVTDGVSIDSGSTFSGSGADLFDIPFTALSQEAIDALISTEIKSGSVTASVTPETGFVVTSADSGSTFTGSIDVTGSLVVSNDITTNNLNAGIVTADEFSGSFSGSFEGDGSGLTNIQLANLSLEINKITSGSVTASVDPIEGFVVTSLDSGSTFTGSVEVTGSLTVVDGIITGDGSGITNIDLANLSIDASSIFTGSVTASVDADGFFRVEDSKGPVKSEFSGSIFVSESVIARAFIGDGSQITNVTSQQSPFIASGSVTASVRPDFGFVVTSADSGSEFTGSVDISGSISASLFQGDGGGLFNIPLDALEDLQLVKINSGSGEAIIDPDKLFVNVPITASRYDGDGSGLFNIPAESLQDLKLDKIESGSAEAIISPNRGLEINVGVSVSQSLSVSGGYIRNW